jgi:MFS family permease
MNCVNVIKERFIVTNPRQVGLVSGAHGMNEFFSLAIPPLLPLIINDLGVQYTEAGLLVSVYFIMYAIFQLPAGIVADKTDQYVLIIGGTFLMAGGMLAASLAPTYGTVLLAVAVSGLGGSTYHPAGMSVISDIEVDTTVGKAMGIHEFAGLGGNLLAPAVLGGLAAVFSWRSALGASSIVGILFAIILALSGGSTSEAAREASINIGSMISTQRNQIKKNGFTTFIGQHLALVKLHFAWWVVGLFLLKLLFTLQSYGVRTYLTTYVVSRTSLTISVANTPFVAFLVGSAVATLAFGTLSDRISPHLLLAATFLIAAIGIATTTVVPVGLIILILWFFLLGILVYAALPVVNTLASHYSNDENSGSLFGIIQTASALGGVISPLVFGAIATQYGISLAFPAVAAVGMIASTGIMVQYMI